MIWSCRARRMGESAISLEKQIFRHKSPDRLGWGENPRADAPSCSSLCGVSYYVVIDIVIEMLRSYSTALGCIVTYGLLLPREANESSWRYVITYLGSRLFRMDETCNFAASFGAIGKSFRLRSVLVCSNDQG